MVPHSANNGADNRHPSPSRLSVQAIVPALDFRAEELESLLLRRLRGASIIFLVGALIGSFLGILRPNDVRSRVAGLLTFFALGCLLTGWLFTRRHARLWVLRRAELLLVALEAAAMTLITLHRLSPGRSEALTAIATSRHIMLWTLESCALYWCFLIVLYGTWIPNTARRCAVVVGSLAVLALTVVIASGLAHPELRPTLFSEIFVVLVFWIVSAAALAVYGSYRINLMRQDAARILGPYRVIRSLGRGGMGEVYLAEHQLLRRPCAIKVIRPERAGDTTVLRRFEREVQVMARLTHWNIVEIFDFGHADDGTFYYTMEYIRGLSLQELIDRDGPMPAPRAIHVLRQVCAALREVHAAGLVHRDVKPVNLLLCQRGGVHDVVKLLDFGIVQFAPGSAEAEQLTSEGKFLGTPLFVSPEQVRGKDGLDGRSDIYSLGAVAYFLLTGEPPFIRDSIAEIFAAHLRDSPAPPSQLVQAVPMDLEAILLRCLEKSPDRRFPDAHHVSQALAQCAHHGYWTDQQAEAWWQKYHPDLLTGKKLGV